jgi:hypothetical protein
MIRNVDSHYYNTTFRITRSDEARVPSIAKVPGDPGASKRRLRDERAEPVCRRPTTRAARVPEHAGQLVGPRAVDDERSALEAKHQVGGHARSEARRVPDARSTDLAAIRDAKGGAATQQPVRA